MAGPWEKFKPAEAKAAGPWAKFQKPKEEPEEMSTTGKVLDAAGRVLDYPGGLLRTGIAQAGEALSPKDDIVTKEDWMSAAKGKAPSSAQYLERAGLDEGPSANLPLLGKTSLRDVEGFGLDVATDPLSLIAKGIRPVKAGLEGVGSKMFKSGLKKVDERLVEKSAKPISDLLMEEGKWGRTKSLLEDTKKIGSEAGADRGLLYDKATEMGAKVDMASVTKGAEKEIAKMRNDPGLKPMADKFDELLERYREQGAVDMKTASEWKTNLYNSLPESAYDPSGKLKGPAQKFQKALARDFKDAIVDSGNKVEKGLGDEINKLNETMQTTITAEKPMRMQVRRDNTKNAISAVDGMIGGYGLADPMTAAGILAAKKLGEASKSTAVRTGGGQLLRKLGQTPRLDDATRRALINILRPEE